MNKNWIGVTTEVSGAVREIRSGAPDVMKGFSALAQAALRAGAKCENQRVDRARRSKPSISSPTRRRDPPPEACPGAGHACIAVTSEGTRSSRPSSAASASSV